ncbi:MAG: MCE family protein [Planctomycetes bacterium]|nr:MCE family protein [Planctomycetota bacterium]
MAIPHRVERIVGIFILLPVLTLSALVLVSGTGKGWFENKLEIEATFDEGMTLRPGALAVMEGVRVGGGDSVEFDPDNRVEVQMKIRKRFASQIRTDSVATITKLSLLGDPVVVITKGSADKPPVEDRVEIQTRATREVQPQELRQLLLDLVDIVAQLNSKDGTIGRITRDEGKLYEDLTALLTSANRLLEKAPPVPVVLTSESSLEMRLNAKLQKQVDGLIVMANRLDQIVANAQKGRGTIGKLLTDEELYNQILDVMKETKQLVADLRVTAQYLKEAAPGIPDLVESGDVLIRRADGLLKKVETNPFLGGPPEKEKKAEPVQIEERFEHYRPSTPTQEDKKQ